MTKNPKPQPIVVTTLCSLCGEDWKAHGDDPTTVDCIRLLRAELARRPRMTTINQPWQPYVQPLHPGSWPWRPQITYSSATGPLSGTQVTDSSSTATVTYLTPRGDDGPEPVGAVA